LSLFHFSISIFHSKDSYLKHKQADLDDTCFVHVEQYRLYGLCFNAKHGSQTMSHDEKKDKRKKKWHKIKKRAEKIVNAKPVKFMGHPSFHESEQSSLMMDSMPDEEAFLSAYATDGKPKPLNREQEHHLFRKMNYLLFCCANIQSELSRLLSSASGDRKFIAKLVKDYRQKWRYAIAVRNQIICANRGLAIHLSKLYPDWQEGLSLAYLAVIKATIRFDFSLGHKFSTYMTEAVRHSFIDALRAESQYSLKRSDLTDFIFDALSARGNRSHPTRALEQQEEVRMYLSVLRDVERAVVVKSFGILGSPKLSTIEIARDIGRTPNRVPEILNTALQRLRVHAGKKGTLSSSNKQMPKARHRRRRQEP
jgi:RNA polymerase sigma factor (sigma-70 family)